ncbi:MAG: DNA alkylation repair protein [Candidatus Margulisiibacteriota bacterium]
MSRYSGLRKDLSRCSDPKRAAVLQRFFKTGPGEYAEGDRFLGVTLPVMRSTVKSYLPLPLSQAKRLLCSKYHEERMAALLILVSQFKKGDPALKKKIFRLYTSSTKYINNWDLIDLTAPHIVGAYLENRSKELLYKFARSKDLWKKRISILATFAYIYKGEAKETLKISRILLNDEHDLIHKAVGWMLREVGKRCSQRTEEGFLKKYYKKMPRTMLRYAIERFPEKLRQKYLKGLI